MCYTGTVNVSDGPEQSKSWEFISFRTAFLSWLFMSSFGIVKLFKNGPVHFLSKEGPIAGFATNRALFSFFSVLFTNSTKLILLMAMIANRQAEQLLYSLESSGPGQETVITLMYTTNSFRTNLFNKSQGLEDVFEGEYRQHSAQDLDTLLIWNKMDESWKYSFNTSCVLDTACSMDLRYDMALLPGIWRAKSFCLANFLLWSSLLLLPPLMLSFFILFFSTSRPLHLPRLLLLQPQLLLTPVFSFFSLGKTPGYGVTWISISKPLTFMNMLLHFVTTIFTIYWFVPSFWPTVHSLFLETDEFVELHKILVVLCSMTILLSFLFTFLALYPPFSRTIEVTRYNKKNGHN